MNEKGVGGWVCETERVGESQRRTERNIVRRRQREGESGKEYE